MALFKVKCHICQVANWESTGMALKQQCQLCPYGKLLTGEDKSIQWAGVRGS